MTGMETTPVDFPALLWQTARAVAMQRGTGAHRKATKALQSLIKHQATETGYPHSVCPVCRGTAIPPAFLVDQGVAEPNTYTSAFVCLSCGETFTDGDTDEKPYPEAITRLLMVEANCPKCKAFVMDLDDESPEDPTDIIECSNCHTRMRPPALYSRILLQSGKVRTRGHV